MFGESACTDHNTIICMQNVTIIVNQFATYKSEQQSR